MLHKSMEDLSVTVENWLLKRDLGKITLWKLCWNYPLDKISVAEDIAADSLKKHYRF